ncbi:MAG: hypothetical protein OM95_04240 [Bdellovibrio sp. ArHS]|uniref:hypothetical protein n=1 Tax=Bdellovibrio sp. ArHS TaxID=1569284 RepID=UPI000583B474|nr:hypothetical protein [Bdellovibrio sp. ArHS]KHD89342.1 MAG: hypothetical protein OM95_04240 [Bdellovibrio sp. ArHS]
MKKNILATTLTTAILGLSLSASAGVGQIGSGAIEVKSCAIHFSNYGAKTPPAPVLQILSQKGYHPVGVANEGTLILKVHTVDEIFAGYKYGSVSERFYKTYASVQALGLFGEERLGDFKTAVQYALVRQSDREAIAAKDLPYSVCQEGYSCLKPQALLKMLQQLPDCNNNVLMPVPAQRSNNAHAGGYDTSNLP